MGNLWVTCGGVCVVGGWGGVVLHKQSVNSFRFSAIKGTVPGLLNYWDKKCEWRPSKYWILQCLLI